MKAIPSRMLVVDDLKINRLLLKQSLEKQGHYVSLAVDGCEALNLLRTNPFDLVLLDIEMPNLDGYQVLAEMKSDPQLRNIPVIIVTAVDEFKSAIRCIEMGAEDYLPKPFNPVLLEARIGACLDKKHLRDKEQLYLKSLERELEIGREIQAGFLPVELPQAPGWEICASLTPAKEVSGDFYDAFNLESGNAICLAVADVCDKGVGAALFMTLFRSLLRFTIGATNAFGEVSQAAKLKYAVTLTNNYIANTHSETGMFATVFLGLLDPSNGCLTYINAGHEYPLVITQDGQSTRLKKSGPAVGIIPDVEYEVHQLELKPGELLFAYTDGATDALSQAGDSIGIVGLLAGLESFDSAKTFHEEVSARVCRHIGEAEQFDDITLLVLKRLGL